LREHRVAALNIHFGGSVWMNCDNDVDFTPDVCLPRQWRVNGLGQANENDFVARRF
jgi:hypothetical protein